MGDSEEPTPKPPPSLPSPTIPSLNSPHIGTPSPDPLAVPSDQRRQSDSPSWNATDGIPKILERLGKVDSDTSQIAKVNLFAKSAMTRACKMIRDRPPTDNALSPLLAKIGEVYTLMTKGQESNEILSLIYGQMARQTLECTDFIVNYSETMNFWKRVGKYVSEETVAAIQNYNKVLDDLMQQSRDRTTGDVTLYRMTGELNLNDMVYAAGAGLDISKCCLPGTREKTLSEIKSWVCSTEKDVPRVLWLSGAPDTGKSAIAHTITKWYKELGGLGACFCFDHTRGADCRHEKMISTIARDLVYYDPFVRRALGSVFHDNNLLKDTTNVIKQWQDLIIAPVGEAVEAIVYPILIVIDGLDESGEVNFRAQFLPLLGSGPNSLLIPGNFRILVTSRPLKDIDDALHTVHVKYISMDDILPSSTERNIQLSPAERDIQIYFSRKLAGLSDDKHEMLARKSGGLFEWARLACEYIDGTTKDPIGRFERVLTESSGEEKYPFDVIYTLILEEMMPERLISMFFSVMGQILASLEPLPMAALTAMREHFPKGHDHHKVERVLIWMRSLLIGIADSSNSPIRPFHESFYDFLKDKSRSRGFFVDVTQVQSDLAFASLRVMEDGLCFNICSLESSYLPNSAVTDLETRVKKSISAELSYSCRFWGTHVQATSFEPSLAKEVEAFFKGERLLFWLEALALMKSLGSSEGSLLFIPDLFKEYPDTVSAAKDTQEFVRNFGTTILHNTPHLYLSALPFAPPESAVYKIFVTHFPHTPRVVHENGIAPRQILRGDASVMSVAVSPDGEHIVYGSGDGRIQVLDRMSDKELYSPKGHTSAVRSIAISPDGNLIVSGSNDKTVQVWNVKNKSSFTHKGHTDAVRSVAISPDGKRAVSGSNDKTIRMWDLETCRVLGDPLQGHTGFVQSVRLNRNRIISGSADNTIRIWDAETREELGILQGHSDWVQSIALSSDESLIVSGSRDKTIRVWNADTRKLCCAPLEGHIDDILSVAISPDGKHIISGSADNTVRVWDVESGGALRASLQKHTDYVRSVAISRDGKYVVSGSDDGTIQEWGEKTFEAPTTFSSDLAGILHSSIHQGSCNLASLKKGWIVDPKGQLLLWIPSDRHPSVANNMLLISDGASRLNLEHFVHGKSWSRCREKL